MYIWSRKKMLLGLGALIVSVFSTAVFATNRPFPQHVTYASGVILPNNKTQAQIDTAVQSAYNAWKTNYVYTLTSTSPQQKFIVYESGPKTVSEAHGYGMVIAAYMGDQSDFDGMYYYFKQHPSSFNHYLMAWKQAMQSGKMVDVEGSDAATDGDLDIAYALLLADEQWGSTGAIDYKSEALQVMNAILSNEVNQTYWNLLVGDWAAQGADSNYTRPSDFMLDHILAFMAADTAHTTEWTNVYNRIISIVNYQFTTGGSANTGLVPDFMVRSNSQYVPVTGQWLETPHDGDYSYNSARTPWRLPMAYILTGRSEILSALTKTNDWIRSVTGGVPNKVRAGYYVKNGVNGTAFETYDDLCFTAPFAVTAMISSSSQTWLNALWTSITGGDYASKVDYFGDAIRMQVLLVASGNWWLPGSSSTPPPPPPTQYTVVASAGANGVITPSGTVTVDAGSSLSFAIAANSGYVVDNVVVDSVAQGAKSSYTFTNIQTNHTISATFKASTSTSTNIAPLGTGYVWAKMTTATANTGIKLATGINDKILTTNVNVSSGDNVNAWEAGGVLWSTPKTVSSVSFINGAITTSGDGYFEANIGLQFTIDGTTWVNSGWALSPSYSYTSTVGSKTYTFQGTASMSNVKGVRVVGQVRVRDGSYYWRVKEIMAMGF